MMSNSTKWFKHTGSHVTQRIHETILTLILPGWMKNGRWIRTVRFQVRRLADCLEDAREMWWPHLGNLSSTFEGLYSPISVKHWQVVSTAKLFQKMNGRASNSGGVFSKYLRSRLRLILNLNSRMAIQRQNSHRITNWLFDRHFDIW